MRSGLGARDPPPNSSCGCARRPRAPDARSISRARASLSRSTVARGSPSMDQRAPAPARASRAVEALRAPLDAGGSRVLPRCRHRERARGEGGRRGALELAVATAGTPSRPSRRGPPRRAAARRHAPAAAPRRCRSPRGGRSPRRRPVARRGRLSRRSRKSPRRGPPERAEARELQAPRRRRRRRPRAAPRAAQDGRGWRARGDGRPEPSPVRPRPATASRRARAVDDAARRGREARADKDVREPVVHRSDGRRASRCIAASDSAQTATAFDLRLRRVRRRARASARRGVCVAGSPRRGNRTSNTTPQRARRRARTSVLHVRHPPRETRWRSPRRRSAPAYFFARSFGQLSNARCCLFRTDGGGRRAVSERSARASAPRARSTRRLVALHLFCGPLGRGRASRSSPSFPARRFQACLLPRRSRGKNLPYQTSAFSQLDRLLNCKIRAHRRVVNGAPRRVAFGDRREDRVVTASANNSLATTECPLLVSSVTQPAPGMMDDAMDVDGGWDEDPPEDDRSSGNDAGDAMEVDAEVVREALRTLSAAWPRRAVYDPEGDSAWPGTWPGMWPGTRSRDGRGVAERHLGALRAQPRTLAAMAPQISRRRASPRARRKRRALGASPS